MRFPEVRSFRDRNPYAVGLVSVAVVAALVALAFSVGIFHLFERAYPVQVVFSDAAGLRTGDDVRVAGVKSGRVSHIEVDRTEGLVVVTILVEVGIDLGPGTEAEIALETLLGAKHVRLTGTVEEPYLADVPEARRVIPRERTRTPFDLFELTRIGTRSIEETDTGKLNQFVNQLADITGGQRETVAELVTGIDRVARAINQREAQLRSLLDHADTLTATLAEKDRTLVALIDQSQHILRVLATREQDLGRALQSGDRAVAELARLLVENKANLQRIIDVLHPTLLLVDRHQESLDRSLAWLGPAFLGQARATSHGPWADIYVRALGPDVIGRLGDTIEQLIGEDP